MLTAMTAIKKRPPPTAPLIAPPLPALLATLSGIGTVVDEIVVDVVSVPVVDEAVVDDIVVDVLVTVVETVVVVIVTVVVVVLYRHLYSGTAQTKSFALLHKSACGSHSACKFNSRV